MSYDCLVSLLRTLFQEQLNKKQKDGSPFCVSTHAACKMGIYFIDMSFAARHWDTGVMSLIVMSKAIKGIFKKQVQSLFIDDHRLSKKRQQIQLTVSLWLAVSSLHICVNTVTPPYYSYIKKK